MTGYKWFNSAYDRNVIHRPQEPMAKGFRDILKNVLKIGVAFAAIPSTAQNTVNNTVNDTLSDATGQQRSERPKSEDYGLIGNTVGTLAAGAAGLYGLHLVNKVRNNIAANSYRTSTPDENGQPGGSATSAYGKNTTANDVIKMSEKNVNHQAEESQSGEHSSVKSLNAGVRSLQVLTKTLLSSLR